MRLLLLSSLLLIGCVSKEQYRSLADSYDAYHKQTATTYVAAVDSSDDPPSVKSSKKNDVAAARATIDAAKVLGQ